MQVWVQSEATSEAVIKGTECPHIFVTQLIADDKIDKIWVQKLYRDGGKFKILTVIVMESHQESHSKFSRFLNWVYLSTV